MLTSQQITNMLELQDRLNRHVNPGWKDAGYDWPMAIMAECTELADQVGWKWWKHQPQAPLTQIHLEVVDIWHFVLSTYLELDRTEDLGAKILIEPDHWCEGEPLDPQYAIRRAKVLAATAGLYPSVSMRLIPEFFSLMRAVRLSLDELYSLYMAKAMLNLFRWDNGYKEGTYQKQWGDVEDNVYLESILHGCPNLPHEQITTLLQQRYQEITS